MKSFSTAGKNAAESDIEGAEPITFIVDGSEFTAYPPTSGQFALMLSAQASHRGIADKVAAMIDFFDGMLEEEDQQVFRRRLLDRRDPMDFDMVEEIMEYLIEEWSARPTQPPHESSSSPPATGRKSTAKRPSTV